MQVDHLVERIVFTQEAEQFEDAAKALIGLFRVNTHKTETVDAGKHRFEAGCAQQRHFHIGMLL